MSILTTFSRKEQYFCTGKGSYLFGVQLMYSSLFISSNNVFFVVLYNCRARTDNSAFIIFYINCINGDLFK